MSDIVLAFKRDRLLVGNGLLHEWMPDWINVETLVHVELLLSSPCTGTICLLCRSSMSRSHQGKHWLSYFVSLQSNWTRQVDDPKFIHDRRASWTFVSLPLQDAVSCRRFLDSQLGKPMNYKGFALLGLGFQSGCCKSTFAPSQQPSWFCSELFTATLRDQGYIHHFNVDACAIRPIDLYQMALTIPGATERRNHPSVV